MLSVSRIAFGTVIHGTFSSSEKTRSAIHAFSSADFAAGNNSGFSK